MSRGAHDSRFELASLSPLFTQNTQKITPALQARLGKMWGTNRVNYGKLENREQVEIRRAEARSSKAPETFQARINVHLHLKIRLKLLV